jgi:hypothetical protein
MLFHSIGGCHPDDPWKVCFFKNANELMAPQENGKEV